MAPVMLGKDDRYKTITDAIATVETFAEQTQRRHKRSMLCKHNNSGSNKKYVCSDDKCLWFVLTVKCSKSKNWKISSMNLNHSETCTGVPKPTARQIAEMRFFRQAVTTHSKSSGTLLTDNFLTHSELGIHIPRGMAYRAQKMVVNASTDDLAESYKFIPSLMESFITKNPGSIATLLEEMARDKNIPALGALEEKREAKLLARYLLVERRLYLQQELTRYTNKNCRLPLDTLYADVMNKWLSRATTYFADEASLMDSFDPIYKAAVFAEAYQGLRIEIPVAEDLHKDQSLLPAPPRKSKYKKRPRNTKRSAADTSTGVPSAATVNEEILTPLAKTPRLEFDADVVDSLGEIV
eukprot:jgi/Phyca11/18495/fgenesh1_pg.PHYCAscaffold_37_\